MDRLVIDIESNKIEASVYHNDTFSEFDFIITTDDDTFEFEMPDDHAEELAKAILLYLESKKTK